MSCLILDKIPNKMQKTSDREEKGDKERGREEKGAGRQQKEMKGILLYTHTYIGKCH